MSYIWIASLDLLINQGLIKEEIIKGDKAGRPKRVYSIVN